MGQVISQSTFNPRYLEQQWLHDHEEEYRGQWLALHGSQLLASGTTAKQVMEEAHELGCPRPLIVRIPKEPELPFGGW